MSERLAVAADVERTQGLALGVKRPPFQRAPSLLKGVLGAPPSLSLHALLSSPPLPPSPVSLPFPSPPSLARLVGGRKEGGRGGEGRCPSADSPRPLFGSWREGLLLSCLFRSGGVLFASFFYFILINVLKMKGMEERWGGRGGGGERGRESASAVQRLCMPFWHGEKTRVHLSSTSLFSPLCTAVIFFSFFL